MFPPPWLGDFCLVVVPHGGAVVPRLRKYRSQPLCFRLVLVPAVAAVVPRSLAVVPFGRAVVPLVRGGSTAGRGLVKWITIGFVSLLYKGCLLPLVDYLFQP